MTVKNIIPLDVSTKHSNAAKGRREENLTNRNECSE